MDITGVMYVYYNENHVSENTPHRKMPRLRKSDEAMMKMRWSFTCKHCRKTLTRKEGELHKYVCEKVPQEIFNDNYFKTPLGGSSVSFGTNCNSSLTNPLLGAPLLK